MIFYKNYRFILLPLALTMLIWLVYWFEIKFNINLNNFGVFPRKLTGLVGVFFSGFIHSGINHLYSNTFPVLILLAALSFFYKRKHLSILVIGYLATGFLTWLIGRESYHIGASGLIYFLFSFLFFNGIKSSSYRLIALSLTVVFVYGGLIWGTLPNYEENISWEGHLSGFVIGFLMSYFISPEQLPTYNAVKPERRKESQFEKEFIAQFDENGNFNPKDPEDPEVFESNSSSTITSTEIEWDDDCQNTTDIDY